MPSGRTHDSITLWSLPLVAAFTFERTQNSSLTLMVSGGFLFGGLMFGPDLDIYSRQYRRWGILRWIWLPYRQRMRHRSFLSHGPVIGTVVRIVYLLVWLGAFELAAIVLGAIAFQLAGMTSNWQLLVQSWLDATAAFVGRSLQKNSAEWIALALGLELGALSHSLSDGIESVYKRLRNSRSKSTNPRRSEPNSSANLAEDYSPEELPGYPEHSPEPPSLPKMPQPEQNSQTPNSPSSSAPPHLRRIPQLPPFGK